MRSNPEFGEITYKAYEPPTCHFCGDVADSGTFNRKKNIALCGGCYEEWVDRFPELDPADLKRVPCSACSGMGEIIIGVDLTGHGYDTRRHGCHTCAGYGWRLTPKSPLERLAEAAEG